MSEYKNDAWSALDAELQAKANKKALYELEKAQRIDLIMHTFELYLEAAREYAAKARQYGIHGKIYPVHKKILFKYKYIKSPPLLKLDFFGRDGRSIMISEDGRLWTVHFRDDYVKDSIDTYTYTSDDAIAVRKSLEKEYDWIIEKDSKLDNRYSYGGSFGTEIVFLATFYVSQDRYNELKINWYQPRTDADIKDELQKNFIQKVRENQTKY